MIEQATITTFGLEFTSKEHQFRHLHDKEHPLYRREIMVAILNTPPQFRPRMSTRDDADPSELKTGWPEGVSIFLREYNTYQITKDSPFGVSESFLMSGWKIPQENIKDVIPEPKFGTKSADRVMVPDMWFRDGYGVIHMNKWLITDSSDMWCLRRGIWYLLGAQRTEALPR